MPRRVTLDGAAESTPAPPRHARRRGHSTTTLPKTTPATPIPVQSPPYSPPLDWEREYCILREAYRRQERRLTKLEQENEALRRAAATQQQAVKCSSKDIPPGTSPITEETSNMPVSASSYSTNSPGTQFVAELVEVMELEVGQHALLSSIIDRQHQEKQKRRCSM